MKLYSNILLDPFWLFKKLTFYQFFETFMVLASVAGLAGQVDASRRSKNASRQQAQQALDNARKQADNVLRKAAEIAYQNDLAIKSLESESEHLNYEYTYTLDKFNLDTEQEITSIERNLRFIDLDLEALALTTEYKAKDAESQAAIYGVRAGLAQQTAKYLEGVRFNTVKEFGLVESLHALDLYSILDQAKTAIEEVDYYAENAILESKAYASKSKQNLSDAVIFLERGKAEIGIMRRNNLRTLGAIKAKAGSYSGSAKDVVADRERELRETEKLSFYSYQIEANAQVAMADVNMFTSQMKEREAVFLKNKRFDILTSSKTAKKQAETKFAITSLGYRNTLDKLSLDIQKAYGEASIYGMYANMSNELAQYIRSTGDIQTREMLMKRQNALADIDIVKNISLLETNRINETYRYQSNRIAFSISSLEEDTIRAQEEAKYLEAEYLDAGRKGYALNISQGNMQSSSYLYQSIGSLFQGLGYAAKAYDLFSNPSSGEGGG